jgi:hypothetical protein
MEKLSSHSDSPDLSRNANDICLTHVAGFLANAFISAVFVEFRWKVVLSWSLLVFQLLDGLLHFFQGGALG